MGKRALWLVAYDIRCPQRLAEALEVVKAWSSGGQKSVHECWLTPRELRTLRTQLLAVVDGAEDSLLLVSPAPGAGVRTLGIAIKPRDVSHVWIG